MTHWQGYPVPAMRHEAWHGDRVLRGFANRPPHVHAMFAASAQARPEATALVCGDQRWCYAELDTASARLAIGLAGQRISRGDRVLMLVGNRAEFIICWLALLRLGAIAVPVGVREQRPGLAFIARQCGAVAVVADAALQERLPSADEAPLLRLRIMIGDARDCPAAAHDQPLSLHALMANGMTDTAIGAPPVHPDEQEVAVILYTSGTTGAPKGAMLTHRNIVHSVLHYQACMTLGPDERSALAVPASHVTGLVAIIATLLHTGGAIVVVPEFKAPAFIALMARERITHTMMVPAMYTLCLMQPGFASADLSAWRIGSYGGAPMPVATIDALNARLPGLVLLNAYGATETTSPTTLMPMGCTRDHADTVGVVLPAADVRVMDEQGVELPAGQTGELWIAGPMVVPGYWDNPQATAENFTAGYWHSGDLGAVDAQGFVRVFDRIKDMLNRGGHKVYSAEVENTLMAWPGMAEAAVVGLPCPVLGERVHAVLCAPGMTPDDAGLRRFCAERLADYKVPETFSWRDAALPRNANGKLMKRLLRAELAAIAGQAESDPRADAAPGQSLGT